MKHLSRVCAIVLALIAGCAFAHGGMEHLKGVIAKVDGTAITLTVEKGAPVVVQTDSKTEFTRGDAKVTLKNVAVGAKAVIHATEHDEKYLARVVKLAPTAASPATDGGTQKSEHSHDHPH